MRECVFLGEILCVFIGPFGPWIHVIKWAQFSFGMNVKRQRKTLVAKKGNLLD